MYCLGHKDLENDSGTFQLFRQELVDHWSPINENLGGIVDNKTQNEAHCPISSCALDKMILLLKKQDVDIDNSTFLDFGITISSVVDDDDNHF